MKDLYWILDGIPPLFSTNDHCKYFENVVVTLKFVDVDFVTQPAYFPELTINQKFVEKLVTIMFFANMWAVVIYSQYEYSHIITNRWNKIKYIFLQWLFHNFRIFSVNFIWYYKVKHVHANIALHKKIIIQFF